jgi:hypothetical protein
MHDLIIVIVFKCPKTTMTARKFAFLALEFDFSCTRVGVVCFQCFVVVVVALVKANLREREREKCAYKENCMNFA